MDIQGLLLKLQEWLAAFGLKVIAALLILLVGIKVASFFRKLVEQAMHRGKIDATLVSFAGNAVYISVITLVTVVALGQIGIETASFIALVGSAGIAVGLALQGSLSNLASGVMLIIFRPFKVGDYIEGVGIAGNVKEIQIFTTILMSPDNKKIIVPNGKLFGDNIINYSSEPERRLDLVFGVGYGDNLQQVKQVILDVLSTEERILSNPAPSVGVLELADNSVNFAVRPWVKTADYWPVYFALQEKMKERFDAEGFNIPFPQRDVHVYNHSESSYTSNVN